MKTSAVYVLALVAAISSAPNVTFAQTSKPNIVFILTDNLGYGDIGAYGGVLTRGTATPRTDSLAKVIFPFEKG